MPLDCLASLRRGELVMALLPQPVHKSYSPVNCVAVHLFFTKKKPHHSIQAIHSVFLNSLEFIYAHIILYILHIPLYYPKRPLISQPWMLVATIASRCCCSWCVDVVVYVCIMFSFNFVFILPIPVLKISASIFVLYFRNFYFNSVSTWRHNCSGELERCLSSLRIPSGSYKHNILYHKKNTQPVSSLCVCTFIKSIVYLCEQQQQYILLSFCLYSE